ncbi:Electron transport complex protein RnfD [hydrothermal vent metagenome]|uniref:Electron transport complex protein RnfD n=1 Tax=hydrothermal vent metagenome TaxID=652676 RepID=A0A3B1B500_9ZZZZ
MTSREKQIDSSPFLRSGNSVSRIMLLVLLALIPGIITHLYFFGWGLLVNLGIAIPTALASEALMLRLRQRPVMPFLADYSAVLTAVLLAIALPSLAPWWLIFIGTAFAIIIAKQLYGGLGYNPFNPAMVGYAMLLIAFPREMTTWLPVQTHNINFIQSLRYSLFDILPNGRGLDSISMATPLDTVKTQLGLNMTVHEISTQFQSLFGMLAGRGWEWVNLMFMFGGIVLIFKRVISWHIPVAVIGSLFLCALAFQLADVDTHASPVFHLFSGATMLGAFFIATDPISAATTLRGRLYYGAGIGILTYIIRSWGGYPDGFAFAVLLMNMAVPTIDYYTQPRVFGHRGD